MTVLLPAWRPVTLSFGFGQQQHLRPQLLELGDQTVSFAGTSQVAHALVGVGRLHVAVKEEIDPIDVLRSAHQKRAANAKGSSGAANAQTWVATVAKRDGMQATVALQDVTGMFVRFGHQTLDALSFLVWLDHAHGQPGIVHDGHDRFVSDLGLLRFGHLAVVAGGLGRLTIGSERMAHRFGQRSPAARHTAAAARLPPHDAAGGWSR